LSSRKILLLLLIPLLIVPFIQIPVAKAQIEFPDIYNQAWTLHGMSIQLTELNFTDRSNILYIGNGTLRIYETDNQNIIRFHVEILEFHWTWRDKPGEIISVLEFKFLNVNGILELKDEESDVLTVTMPLWRATQEYLQGDL